MLGRRGLAWSMAGAGLRYLSPRFHPWKRDNRETMQHWLAAHQSRLRPLKG